jgi:DNA-binding response OmpR family regulator
VVEDDPLIAFDTEQLLQDFGCAVVGPVGKLEVAMRLADEEAFDVALLDVNIRGGRVFPVAERLRARGIPFALASGYGDWALPEDFRNLQRLSKPFTRKDLEAKVLSLQQERATISTKSC